MRNIPSRHAQKRSFRSVCGVLGPPELCVMEWTNFNITKTLRADYTLPRTLTASGWHTYHSHPRPLQINIECTAHKRCVSTCRVNRTGLTACYNKITEQISIPQILIGPSLFKMPRIKSTVNIYKNKKNLFK